MLEAPLIRLYPDGSFCMGSSQVWTAVNRLPVIINVNPVITTPVYNVISVSPVITSPTPNLVNICQGTTGIPEHKYDAGTGDVMVYPNPAATILNINFAERNGFKMQIYNVIGECVLQRELNISSNTIDISSLSKGVYVIQLTGADRTIQHKLIKE
jgi:hypothetical protein